MHLNQPQKEQHQQEQTIQISNDTFSETPDNIISLASDECGREIKTLLLTSDNEKFAGSSSSSTDSGVNISDTETTSPPSPLPQSQQLHKQTPTSITISDIASTAVTSSPLRNQLQQNYNNNSPSFTSTDNKTNNNSIQSRYIVDGNKREANTSDSEFKSDSKQFKTNSSNDNTSQANIRNAINIENVINNSHTASAKEKVASEVSATAAGAKLFNQPRAPSPSTSSVVSSSDASENPPFHIHHYHHNGSPVVSVRSINSSIIYTSDSDSEDNGNLEGEHKNYVIKKLGTQVTYPPNHPNIPVINNGLKVVDQKITPNGMGPPPASPLKVIQEMCDNVDVFHPHRQVATTSSIRPQVAISSSTDVTIGDKHFYEGPVTIQQFLIDSRNKWNEGNGTENVVFTDENGDSRTNAKDINEPPTANLNGAQPPLFIRKKFMIAGACAVITLIILAIVLGIEVSAENKNIVSGVFGGTYEDEGCVEGKLCIVDRDIWRAHPQKQKLLPQNLPIQRVTIAHTASEPCDSLVTCSERVRVIQEYHMNSFNWDDIGYNFLVSSDGRVYVGRGWDDVGAVVKGFNVNSVGIAFIGTFMRTKPTEAQLNACRLLLEEGVRLKKLKPDYILNGARQLSATESPGDALYKIIQTWPHWTTKIFI
ncbi:peptidoglycan-recognition protein LC-like isoform X2 [Musca autumnalis]|uniref:peptidoglycan-recognition protein LC-like isoform X2 n=1 Tax=Musca autumnalis TaxID=221902 RepID=UPI003CF4EA12